MSLNVFESALTRTSSLETGRMTSKCQDSKRTDIFASFLFLLKTLLFFPSFHRFHGFGVYVFMNGERYEGELRGK